MIEALRNAFRLPDLRRKLLITLGILVIYRLASHIPVPGVNPAALRTDLRAEPTAGPAEHAFRRRAAELLGDGDGRVSVHHGVHHHPVADPDHPAWQEMQKEGDAGRRKLNQYTIWLTIPLALLQAFGQPSHPGPSGATQSGAVLREFGFGSYPLQTIVDPRLADRPARCWPCGWAS